MQPEKFNVYRYIGCIIDQSNWSGPFSGFDARLGVQMPWVQIPVGTLDWKFLFKGLFHLLLLLVL